MIGFPQNGLIFLCGIRLLPPRAGIRAIFFHLFLPFCDSLEDLINPPNLKIHTFYES